MILQVMFKLYFNLGLGFSYKHGLRSSREVVLQFVQTHICGNLPESLNINPVCIETLKEPLY